MATIVEIATSYAQRGWKVIPVPFKEKGPVIKGWQNLRFEAEAIPFIGFEDGKSNIGILMGEPSNLVCVDLDNEASYKLAPMFLPATDLKSGRGENPSSHWYYTCPAYGSTVRHAIPAHAEATSHATVELLSTGAQVIVGPSIHPSSDLYDVLAGEPAEIDFEELKNKVLALHRATLAMLGIQEEPPKPIREKKPIYQGPATGDLDLYQELTNHGAIIHGESETSQGCKGFNVACPREALHTTPTKDNHCMVWTGPGGGWQARCQHTSCGIKSWQDFKVALDPNWLTQEELLATVDISAITNRLGHPAPVTPDDFDDLDDDDLEEQIGTAEIGFPEECLRPPGLIAKIVDYNLATAKYPQPEHALAGALSLMSLITGRRVCDHADTRTNLMIVALGPTRSGKEHPRQINKKILEYCGKTALYEEKLASHSSLHGFLKQDNVGLLMNDEFGDFLALARATKGANTQSAQIISAMIKLFSSSNGLYKADRYADNTKQIEINQPHLVLYGTSTGEVFWKHVTPEYLSGGLFGRTMIFENRGYVDPVPTRERPGLPEDVLQEIQGWFSCFSHYDLVFWQHPTPIVVPHDSAALERFEKHELAIASKRKRETAIRAALWSGTAEITAKLALLFACSRSRNPLQIKLCDVDLAISLSNWLTRRKVELSGDNVAENQTESAAKRVFRIIKDAGKTGISLYHLGRRTQWLKLKERQELINGLVDNRLVYRDLVKTGKRDKTVLMARHYAKQLLLK